MPIDIPRFSLIEGGNLPVVRAEAHVLAPAVRFEMLGSSALCWYNIQTAKEENLYLADSDGADDRQIVTELDPIVAAERMAIVLDNFTGICERLRSVSDRQLQGLADYAAKRLLAPGSL